MTLHADAAALLDELYEHGYIVDASMTPCEMRANVAARPKAEGEAVSAVSDLTIPGSAGQVRMRHYRPLGALGVIPLVLYFHGGGWVTGDLDTHDARCRSLANLSQCGLVSVDYRLAPEHPFPAAFDDAVTALIWAATHAPDLDCDPARLAVSGDSSGGNLAAAAAIFARDEGIGLRQQTLVYPVLHAGPDHFPSYAEHGGGVLSATLMDRYLEAYAGDADHTDWRLAPFHHDDLEGVAPALVVTAEVDPLRDEAEAYAVRLAEAGVAVDLTRYAGMFHGFMAFPDRLDAARHVHRRVGSALRAATAL